MADPDREDDGEGCRTHRLSSTEDQDDEDHEQEDDDDLGVRHDPAAVDAASLAACVAAAVLLAPPADESCAALVADFATSWLNRKPVHWPMTAETTPNRIARSRGLLPSIGWSHATIRTIMPPTARSEAVP